MAAVNVLGDTNPVETGRVRSVASKNTVDISIEGLVSALDDLDPATKVPSGYVLDSSQITENGDGTGRMTIHCITYETQSSFSPARVTFRVDMVETTLDLITHAHITNKTTAAKWLATDEADRGPDGDGKIYYRDAPEEGETEGELVEITDQDVKDFAAAYVDGITQYLRFDPVIEKISTWKNPPGLTRTGNSFSGGTPEFASDLGKFSTPPLTLSGYPNTNWFKSKDTWVENADKTWTRTEQWTYTPDGSNGTHAWIYAVANSSSSSSNSSGGSSS